MRTATILLTLSTLLLIPEFLPGQSTIPGPSGAAQERETPAPLGARLAGRIATLDGDEVVPVFVYLNEKPARGPLPALQAASLLSPRALARRARALPPERIVTERDLPVDPEAVTRISELASRPRHVLKWFNAVSVDATGEQIERIRRLPFVREVELVGRFQGRPEPVIPDDSAPDRGDGTKRPDDVPAEANTHLLNYGASLTQNAQIGVTELHDLGIFGAGVMVGVFDNGFRLLSHQAFDSMTIVAQYDFVDKKVSVIPNNPSTLFGSHGVNTLSTIGGYRSGQLIGPAFRSTYVLARTENDSSETPVEEDNWAAAIEWADSIGIDVASTSLGYVGYDAPWPSWSWVNMDGNTTVITRAADHAVSLGIVVVNSAGNSGAGNGTDNTLVAPSDGDSVIAAGAVSSTGIRASFSSVGPTTDVPSRIKPDVMAMGVGVRVASASNPSGYGSANGTSFSCPLTAGVAALLLSANPSLTPIQVRDAMRNTANNASSPNNQYGWGILDADSAAKYWGIVPMASLSGTVFHDLDGDGVRDGGEPALEGQTVLLSGVTADTALSGPDGSFAFGDVAVGAQSLTAATPAGWIVSTPAGSLSASVLHRDTLGGFAIGLFQPGAIGGVAFNDTSGNGAREAGEPALVGWTVRLAGPVNATVLTGGAGEWSFTGLPGGAYSVTLDPQPGWLQTQPAGYGPHAVTVVSGLDTSGLAFGSRWSPGSAWPVNAGWNLLSLPVAMADARADSVYPHALSPLFFYDGGYETLDTIPNGRGYWVKLPSAKNVVLEGLERTVDTVEVVPGWNLIGTLSVPILSSSVVTDPPGILTSKFYHFDKFAYHGVSGDSVLLPHLGYWVKSSDSGRIILDGAAGAPPPPSIWVGQAFFGGVQCDEEVYEPPDIVALLQGAGIPVEATAIQHFGVCQVCYDEACPDYAAVHYALIAFEDLAEAEALGFTPQDPPTR